MAPTKVLAEYAKSGRSTCKGCGKGIGSGLLRVGSSTKDPRGFDSTKWYNLDCFPVKSNPIGSVEDIVGVASLKEADKEALRKMVAGTSSSEDKKMDGDDAKQSDGSPAKRPKRDHDDASESDGSMKKQKVFASIKDVQPMKVLAEYAKSGRSTCKGCGNGIGSGSLRVGSSAKDPRGFDSTRWYHLDCFAVKSSPIGSVEDIVGIALLKEADKEALRNMVARASSSEDKMDRDDAKQSDGSPAKRPKRDRDDANESDGSSMKKPKVSASLKDAFEIEFSVSESKDHYKDAKLSSNWKAFQTVIFNIKEDGLHDSAKIAAFDFDGCLANTNVRKTGASEWSLMYSSIPEKLKGLYNDGYKLVIFTNEANIGRWKNKRQAAVDSKIGRLDNFMKRVEVPLQVFIACGVNRKGQIEDPFRKPSIGMWTLLKKHFNSGIVIDMNQSFYVGDAAGRKDDHGDADIKFANAIGLKFYVPEEYFDAK